MAASWQFRLVLSLSMRGLRPLTPLSRRESDALAGQLSPQLSMSANPDNSMTSSENCTAEIERKPGSPVAEFTPVKDVVGGAGLVGLFGGSGRGCRRRSCVLLLLL